MNSIYDVLTNIGYDLKDFGKSFRAKPLYRDSNNNTSLIIDKETGKWHDFGTNQGGDLNQLVKITLNIHTEEDLNKVLGGYTPTAAPKTIKLEQPKTYSKELLIKLKKDYSYWIKRGVSASTLETFEGGVADNGKMANRFVFPIFNSKDEIVGFSGRDITGKSNIKWKLLSKKSEWVYPKQSYPYIQKNKTVILVESIGNMLSLYEIGIKNVLVIFGLKINPQIKAFLISRDIQKINILFDNDENNSFSGNEAAKKAAKELEVFFDESQIKIITPPLNDINDLLMQNKLKDFCSKMELYV